MAKRILSDWKTTVVGIGILTVVAIAAYKDPGILSKVEIQGLIATAIGLVLASDRNQKESPMGVKKKVIIERE